MSNRKPNATTFLLKLELETRGYQVTYFEGTQLCLVEKGGKRFFFSSSKTQLQNQMSFWIAQDKYLTKKVLKLASLPTAKGVKMINGDTSPTEKMQFPLVIKPLDKSGGEGVHVGVRSIEEISKYLAEHSQYKEILAEEMLEGEDVRILIVGGKFFAAVKRIPAHVIGDGIHTIFELVENENKRRSALFNKDREGNTFSSDLDLIVFDEEAQSVVRSQGCAPESIPSAGERFFVRKNANTSTGGVSVDVTDDVCMGIRTQCEAAASSLMMTLAGIDIMTKDLSRPLSLLEKSGIVEVNASPGLDLHVFTDIGTRRNPVPLIVDEIEEYFQKMGTPIS